MAFADPNAPITNSLFRTDDPPNARVEMGKGQDVTHGLAFYTGHASESSPGLIEPATGANYGEIYFEGPGMTGSGATIPKPFLRLTTYNDRQGSSSSLEADEIKLVAVDQLWGQAALVRFGDGSDHVAFDGNRIYNEDHNSFTIATLAGTWTNIGGVWPSTRFRLDPDGFCHVTIAATGGAAPLSTIFTLPVGCRPGAAYPLFGEGNSAYARATVLTSGVVQFNVGSTTNILFNGRFPTSNIP